MNEIEVFSPNSGGSRRIVYFSKTANGNWTSYGGKYVIGKCCGKVGYGWYLKRYDEARNNFVYYEEVFDTKKAAIEAVESCRF